MSYKTKRSNKVGCTPFPRTAIAVAVSMLLSPLNVHAAPKLSAIDLPAALQTGAIGRIRSSKTINNGALFAWQANNAIYAQRINSLGKLDGQSIPIVGADNNTNTGNAVGSFGLTGTKDDSFVVAWAEDNGWVWAAKVANNPGDKFEVGEYTQQASDVLAFSKNTDFAIAWESSIQRFGANTLPDGDPIALTDGFDSIAMDNGGDFWVVKSSGNNVSVRNTGNDGKSIEITPSKVVATYDFDDAAHNKFKSVSFEVNSPVISANSKGEFVVVWEEVKTETTRKPRTFCQTYNGKKECYPDGYNYSSKSAVSVVAKRYGANLTAKDSVPVVVATATGTKTYSDNAEGFIGASGHIEDVAVSMDDDGDFTVAYSAGKTTGKTKTKKDEFGGSYSYAYQLEQSDVLVSQFTSKNGKLVAGKALKVSAPPKVAAKHTVKNSINQGASIVVTDEASNAFIVMWHNDYEDHRKDPILQDAYDKIALLMAKRYGN